MSDWTPHADAVVRAVPEDEAAQAVRDALEKRYRALIERLREAGDETWANNLAGHNSYRSEPAKCSLAVLEMMVEEIHQLRGRPRETPMPDQFRETAGNLNTADDVQDKLTAAEQAVARLLLYEEGSEWAVDTERHIELARAVVPVVRPIIEAEVLGDAAEALAQAAAQKGREPYLTSQRLRFGLTAAAQRLRDRAEAARQAEEGRTDG